MVSTIFANFHQGCQQFQPFNGIQCTAVALIALLMFMRYSPNVDNITSSDLNDTIVQGTDLYRYIHSRGDVNGYLSHRDLPSDLSSWNGSLGEITYYYDIYFGTVSHVAQDDFGQTTFDSAFHEGIQLSSYHLVTFQDVTVAVYYSSVTGSVYLFDSHQRNCYGLPDENGSGILLSFSDVNEFLTYINTVYYDKEFELTPIHFPYWLNAGMFF